MKNVLICGDSFAADWSVKYTDYPGWPTLLSQKYNVTNMAQAGCSEYKILKQLQSQDLTQYYSVIVVHTSPFRIPVEDHPIHHNDILHCNSDFIYLDVKASNEQSVNCVTEYYEKYFWPEYALFMHQCVLTEELKILKNQYCVHSSMMPWDNLVQTDCFINFHPVFTQHRGLVNHLTKEGNEIIFQKFVEMLQ
jgi:hypothetical protein